MTSRGGLNQSLQLCTEFQTLVRIWTFVTKPVRIWSGFLPEIRIFQQNQELPDLVYYSREIGPDLVWISFLSLESYWRHHLPGEGYKDIIQKSIDSYSPYWPAGQGCVCPWPFGKSYHLHTNVCQTILGDPVWLIYILNIWVWSTLLVYYNCVYGKLLY